MHIASQKGYLDVVSYLVRSGVDPDQTTADGSSPVYTASYLGHLEVVKFLVTAGADKEKPNKYGASPVHIASQQGHVEIVKFLVRAGVGKDRTTADGLSPLYLASKNGHQEIVEFLWEARADLERASTTGATPVHTASKNGHVAIVDFLVRAGADLEVTTHNGTTPLYIASENGRLEVVKCLVDAGADKARHGSLPVYIANLMGHLDVVKYLLGEAGRCAPPTEAVVSSLAQQAPSHIEAWLDSIGGWQPLHFACEANDQAMIVRLLRQGASPAAAAAGGITPNMLGSGATRALVTEALVWTPDSHALFPSQVRAAVHAALLLHARARGGALAAIPTEVLFDALGFLPRADGLALQKPHKFSSFLMMLGKSWLKRWKAILLNKAGRWGRRRLTRAVSVSA